MGIRVDLYRTVLTFVVPALLLACGGSDSTTGIPEPSEPDPVPEIAEVSVSPDESSLEAIDATVTFEATLRDEGGDEITERGAAWSSTDTDVAEVDRDGVATAVANGTTEIVAEADGVADTAVLTVEQAVAAITVEPSSVTLDAPGDTAHLAAEASDANGHPVEDAAFSWSSDDPSVVTVDDEGVVTAESEGEAQVSATVGEVSDAIDVAVGQEETP